MELSSFHDCEYAIKKKDDVIRQCNRNEKLIYPPKTFFCQTQTDITV